MQPANTSYRLAIGVALAAVLFLVLAIGALGVIGEGGRPDRLYLGVLAVGLLGAVVARLRSRGMALTLLAMALAQTLVAAVAVIAVAVGVRDFEGASIVDILGINAMFVALFGLSAWLFARASQQRSAAAGPGALGVAADPPRNE